MGADYSITDLIQPPQIIQLKKRHKEEIAKQTVELHKMLASFKGTAIHNHFDKMLNRVALRNPKSGYSLEVRLWDRILNRKVTGQYDCYRTRQKILYDFKTTSVWKKILEGFTDYERQLNYYTYLLSIDGYDVKKLRIIAWYMDYDKNRKYSKGYPNEPVEELPMKLWTPKQQEDDLKLRLRVHIENEQRPDHELTPCDKEDRWEKPTKYAVWKKGNEKKRYGKATRVLDTRKAAENYIKKKKKPKEFFIEKREGERTRCEHWCSVAFKCYQYKKFKEGQK
jgi:hypothetical protein